ncbi:hypothetical protein C5748_12955 [Phyllobacterium phragmitis]|uniref:Uncharacterized protein n=1 Tax=Phyllobacterium phragmitis TaxID=2670329 RepID=A0A2S9IRF5_9HYPH|nr:hypothetical protein C5748_12955 [Phyllobacterium phragmitis]
MLLKQQNYAQSIERSLAKGTSHATTENTEISVFKIIHTQLASGDRPNFTRSVRHVIEFPIQRL